MFQTERDLVISLIDMLENSKGHMDNIALTFDERKITYEEMFESINKYAKMLYSKYGNT